MYIPQNNIIYIKLISKSEIDAKIQEIRLLFNKLHFKKAKNTTVDLLSQLPFHYLRAKLEELLELRTAEDLQFFFLAQIRSPPIVLILICNLKNLDNKVL